MELRDLKGFIIGFLFGTFGLYVLALLALALPFIERASGFLFAPGRFLAVQFVGYEGSTVTVVLLTLANGVFYGLVGATVEFVIRRFRASTSSAHKH